MSPLEKNSDDKSKSNEEEKKNLWSQILNEVQKHGKPKLSPYKQILVLGDNESGKTTMVAKLQGLSFYIYKFVLEDQEFLKTFVFFRY